MLKYGGNIRRSRRCCQNTVKKNQLVAAAGCPDDLAAVAALPIEWDAKHAGPTLTNYLREQRNNHEIANDDLIKEARIINQKIDSRIRSLSENLLSHTNQIESDMCCLINNIKQSDETPEHQLRIETLKRFTELHSQRLEDIAAFRIEALSVERERADEVRKLLQKQFRRLVAIGLHPPRVLLHDFDQRAYEVNQQLLSNCRAFAELEATLRARADEFLVRTRSNFNQLCLGISESRETHSALPRQYNSRLLSKRPSSSNANSKHDLFVHCIINETGEVDECISVLVHAYKAAVMNIISGFTNNLRNLSKFLACQNHIQEQHVVEKVDILAIIDRILKRFSTSVQNSQQSSSNLVDVTRAESARMQKSLFDLGERLQETYIILHDSAHLWDAHMLRVALAQKLIMTSVEDLLTNNDTRELGNEVYLNIALEQACCASDVDKLQTHYDYILHLLGQTADLYKNHSETEYVKLEEFMKFPSIMGDIVISEFHCFLEKYPRKLCIISSDGLHRTVSPRRIDGDVRLPLPRIILQTELQDAALLNWKNGFLETLENNMSQVTEELMMHARKWVDDKARFLSMRYSLNCLTHSIRKERVKAARDNRFAELKFNEARLDSHLAAISKLINRLHTQASEYLALDSPELYPLCKWIADIQACIETVILDNPDPEVKRLKMCSYASRLLRHRNLFEISLTAAIKELQKSIETRLQEARISNVRFMSQIKLFSEGGRYAAAEATKASAALMRGADSLELCFLRATELLTQRKSQLLALADQKIAPLQRIVDEFSKSAKSPDKRKPQPVKKK